MSQSLFSITKQLNYPKCRMPKLRGRPLPSLELGIHCLAQSFTNTHLELRTKCRELNAKETHPLDERAGVELLHPLVMWSQLDDLNTTTN